ncbi:MAG: hypothetical protein AAFZ15_28610 [Bacteroidota bacterium]
MQKYFLFFLVPFFFMSKNIAQEFITQKGIHFYKNNQPYYFFGTNFWYGMNLASKGAGGDRQRLIRELDHLKELGIKNLRIMAASEGPDTAPWRMLPALQTAPGIYNEELLDGLDFLLSEMRKRDMHAVLCLNNMWPWSGGMAQYRSWVTGEEIPYPPPAPNGKWLKYMNFSARFFSNEQAMDLSHDHIRYIVKRKNRYNGLAYVDDPTIMAWQLANEPRAIINTKAYYKWVKKTAALIKSLDPNHLVSVGSEGNAFVPLSRKFKKENQGAHIDYATMHIWVQNWGWYDPERPEASFQKALKKAKKYIRRHVRLAERLQKPLVLEEFGIARDGGSHDPSAGTVWRDKYYEAVFSLVKELKDKGAPIAGTNFWAWAGEGRPKAPRAVWQVGDDFIGDPPFEYQGWYSVYDADASTLALFKKFKVTGRAGN